MRCWRCILASFAPMHPRIDPPSSALQLTPQSLKQKAETEKAYAVVENDRLAGCIFCQPEPPDCLYIGKLAVAPDAQGRGVGRLMLRAAEAYAAECRLPCLRLETRIELRESPAVRTVGLCQNRRSVPSRLHAADLHRDAQGAVIRPCPAERGPAGDGRR